MFNYLTKAPYTGNNEDVLATAGYENPYFLTYRQALSIGRQVRKGERGITLQRIVWVEEIIKGAKRKVRKPKRFTVFNIDQTEEVQKESEAA
jgi:antirestriction protein ArdC